MSLHKMRRINREGGITAARARGHHVWTDDEVDRLIELRQDEAMEWPEIADALGLSQQQCESKFNGILYRQRIAAGRQLSKGPSNAAMIDAEKRARARDQQDLTATLFGDPPPGYSALDGRRE